MLNAATLVPPANLPDFLPYALPWIERTINQRGWFKWNIQTIVAGLQQGHLQLWMAQEGEAQIFVITQVLLEEEGKAVHIVLGGGSIDDKADILQHISLIENYAKNIGATSVVIWGREGWKRKFAPHGYNFEAVMLRRRLTDRMH